MEKDEEFFFRKMKVYQAARKLVVMVYQLLKTFPKEEQYALCDQMRRAVVSVPSNLAEGIGRFSDKEKIHFIDISYGSLMETLCQMEVAFDLGYVSDIEFSSVEQQILEISKMEKAYSRTLKSKLSPMI